MNFLLLVAFVSLSCAAAPLRSQAARDGFFNFDTSTCRALGPLPAPQSGQFGNFSFLLQEESRALCWAGTGIPVPQCSFSPSDTVTPALAQRRGNAFLARLSQAAAQADFPADCFSNNGDEATYSDFRNSYSKGLTTHSNVTGLVDPVSYQTYLTALLSQSFTQLAGVPNVAAKKLVNPQGGLWYPLAGADTSTNLQPPAPQFTSNTQAAEAIEVYWMSLLRDVNFADYATNALAQQAIAELSTLSGFTGPTPSPQTLFRGNNNPAASLGPYISQFLYQNVAFGASTLSQQVAPATSGDFMTTFAHFVNIQNGGAPEGPIVTSPTKRYIINGRDLTQWVHVDRAYQGAFVANAILSSNAAYKFQNGIPYSSGNQAGFVTFGAPNIDELLAQAGHQCLGAVWYNKWYVHRRARPEVFAARFDRFKGGALPGYVFHQDLLNSATNPNGAAHAVNAKQGNYLLSQAFPEGSPGHPSYGQGHACITSASVHILKAFYNNSVPIVGPVQPSSDGSTLVSYTGTDVLTVGGELNKLISNIGQGRNIAGVHFRSDGTASEDLGFKIAVSILTDFKATVNEPVTFVLTKPDGVTTVTI
jgi:hypothetical protein